LILAVGLVVGLVAGLPVGLSEGLRYGLVVGLGAALVAALFAGLVRGLTFSQVETRAIPNEGIHRSTRNALFVGLVFAPVGGLLLGLLFGLFVGLFAWWLTLRVDGLFAGLFVGLLLDLGVGLVVLPVVGLVVGGDACLKHFILRVWLVRNELAPWNYVRFLDHAAERILMRKVGGGYAFIHRMLLEHFAARYVEPQNGEAATAIPSPIDTKR
jgi:hypothetical protein